MNKICGKKTDFAYIREDASRIVIGYGLKALEGENLHELYEWYEIYLYKKQLAILSLDVVKDVVIGDINARTTASIINGFDYIVKHGAQAGEAVNVWLSKENQEDFHAMHQNADGLTFPLRYKIGELDGGIPVYEEFADASEMHNICILTTNHVLSCQQKGWEEKDAVDFTPYEEILNPVTE